MTTDSTELGGLSTNADYIAALDVGERRNVPSGMTSKRETYWTVMANIARARMKYGEHWHIYVESKPSLQVYKSRESALQAWRMRQGGWMSSCADTECMKRYAEVNGE